MLEIKNLTKKYGDVVAVKDLSLALNEGEIFGFIGPNGAGKSTTIRSILNYIKKDQGEVYFDGKLLDSNNLEAKKNIGYLPSEISLYESLTGKKMIEYCKGFYKNVDDEYVNKLMNRLKFDDSKLIEDYSLGNRKKLGIILCLMHNPKLIIMDEATSGLDPLIQEEFYEILKEEKGKIIFFSSHYLEEVKKICDRIGIIKEGKLIKVDNIENIIDSQGVIVTLNVKENFNETLSVGKIISFENNVLKFYYDGDKESLLKIISSQSVTRFLVEEPSIEEVFLHFYE